MLQVRVPHTVESWLLEQITAKALTSYRDYCAGVTAQIFILPIPISMEENSRENFIPLGNCVIWGNRPPQGYNE